MILNFLKRNKTTQRSILLYYYLDLKPVPKQQMDTPILRKSDLSNLSNLPSEEKVKSETGKEEDQGNKVDSPDLTKSECGEEIFTYSTSSVQKWNRAKDHIKNLLHEISGSQTSEDFNLREKETLAELFDDKTQVNIKENQSVTSTRNKSLHREKSLETIERIDNTEHKSTKHPLDVHELQTIAAMAKRLRIHSKIKRPTTLNKH